MKPKRTFLHHVSRAIIVLSLIAIVCTIIYVVIAKPNGAHFQVQFVATLLLIVGSAGMLAESLEESRQLETEIFSELR